MAKEQDVIRLPFKITDKMSKEEMIVAAQRNFAEIEQRLALLQGYIKAGGDGSVSGITTKMAEWNDTYLDTAQYRTADAPSNAPKPSGINKEMTKNGGLDVTLYWNQYEQGDNAADFILVFWSVDSAMAPDPTAASSCVAFGPNTDNDGYYTFSGLASEKHYSYGIAAARITKNNLMIGEIICPDGILNDKWEGVTDWHDFTQGDPDYVGLIDGVEASQITEDVGSLNTFVTVTYPADIGSIQGQLDGKIETWFYSGAPTLANLPASDWTTDELKDNHLGDLYYDTATGYAYRFMLDGATYGWTQITDEAIVEALQKAKDAWDLADRKRVVFIATPTPPYDEGDLWTTDDGELYQCKAGIHVAADGEYSSSDWKLATKYTDDSGLQDFVDNTYAADQTDVWTQIDGKIETWYQATDPNTWVEADRAKHDGDMWYNKTTGVLRRYDGALNTWQIIENQMAADAYATANKANDTADGKRRIFTSTPTPPYDKSDLWADGPDGELYRCITAKTPEDESFLSADFPDEGEEAEFSQDDWELATHYNLGVDGTVKYRTSGAPTLNPTPTAIDIDANTDGSIDIKLSWAQYPQDEDTPKQADMLLLFWEKCTAAEHAIDPLGPPEANDACIAFSVNTTGPSFHRFDGIPSDMYYSFGIAAARRTESGLEIGPIQSPDYWQDVTRGTPDYLGNIKSGGMTVLDQEGIMQTWQDSRADNVDATHGLLLSVYLPSDTVSIHRAILRFRLQAFRAYEEGAEYGGGSTSGASSSISSGASSVETTAEGGGKTETSLGQDTESSYAINDETETEDNHNHGLNNGTELRKADGGTVWFYWSGGHSHKQYKHSHDVELGDHVHGMDHTHTISHTHTTPNHTHPLSFGIHEGTAPTSVTVKVGTTTIGTYYADQTNIDISSGYLNIGTWNDITITPNRLGRIDATVFIQAKMGV